jgi:hypothetical protein
MSMPTREELRWRFRQIDDPEIEVRRRHLIEMLLDGNPDIRQRFIEKWLSGGRLEGWLEGRLTGTRAALRRVLARRQLTLSMVNDLRIEACADLATLERWLDQAVNAVTVADALG